ncbi:hypothetical protein T492DRAFT_856520 [Pavlovales sp. CCMP2436]|nr:hypothetical protein T492DRAFT_856520 [Pavlovales sp. CCMP2436]
MMLLFATMLLLLSRAVTGAVSRGGEQHAETPLKATKATTTMLLPAAAAVAAAAEARPRRGQVSVDAMASYWHFMAMCGDPRLPAAGD